MPATVTIHSTPEALSTSDTLLLIGRRDRLLADDVRALVPASVGDRTWRQMVKRTDPGDVGRVAATFTGSSPVRVVAGVLPEPCSRHNTPARSLAIPGLVAGAGLKGDVGIVLCVDEVAHAMPSVLAAARAHPTFSATSRRVERQVGVVVMPPGGPIADTDSLQIMAEACRYAAHLVDQPPDRLGVDALVQQARSVAAGVGASVQVLRASQLHEQGLGGLHGVGRAAEQEPALVVLDHAGSSDERVVWVGKGIVYDTGGLSIKSKAGMPGMKTDMGGAAAVLAAFRAAVQLGATQRLTAVLCVAENAVGPKAVRPDDILTMYSGKSVEVNNTDAEGRLVLADGVAWSVRHRTPDLLVDVATLTGAQGVATGRKHGALYASTEGIESRAVAAGRASGDLVHPLPYAPELFRREFQSSVADMRNSVKNRNNAQSSCAGQFIANHLPSGFEGEWLHVDMAGPSTHNNRGTGFGVGLLLTLAGVGAPLAS